LSLPGFNAKVSLYSAEELYSMAVTYDALVRSEVIPQGCAWWMWARCGAAIITCIGRCALIPLPWCVSACLEDLGAPGSCINCV
jgi:hypothetical protein